MLSLFQKGIPASVWYPKLSIWWQSDPGKEKPRKEVGREIIWVAEHGIEWHLSYSSLSLINATKVCPGDQDWVWFWLQLKGSPTFSLLCLQSSPLSHHPRDSLFPNSVTERRARNHNLKMASQGNAWIRLGGIQFQCENNQELWTGVELDWEPANHFPSER